MINATQVISNIGDILFDIGPELDEMVEENDISQEIIDILIKIENDAEKLRKYVYGDFYKDELH